VIGEEKDVEEEEGGGVEVLPKPFKRQRFSLFRKTASSVLKWRGSSSLTDSHSLYHKQRPLMPGSIRIVATTWNMGGGVGHKELEGGLPPVLHQWLPRDYDLYIIGVQECQCLRELRNVVHEYLDGPEAYAVYVRELGDSRLLGVIAVMMFVRTRHVTSGAFEVHQSAVGKVAAGVNLGPIGKAPNKVGG